MKIYVNINAPRKGDGSEKYPLRTISEAALIAVPGDEVIVAPGIYREYVDPANAGTPDARITYRSAEEKKAVITGSEVITGWTKHEGNVWKVTVPNKAFGNYNPYTTMISGDWFDTKYAPQHTGEVFINGKSLYEVSDISKVLSPEIYKKSWDPDFSVNTWYTEQDTENDETVIYANFQGKDPNKECVEITFRRNCFLPSKEGIGYITLSGFTVKQAATQWAPPTAYQDGMIGPHWSKGWIIEDCEISHSKCSGISIGKYEQPNNDNKWGKWKFKDGTQTERDCICQARNEGWTKDTIGSHIIRRCDIHDCGQTGIVGHLGGVFSLIEDNHIHNINNKQNLGGAEIGGIKLHAAIDVIIRRNHFHHNTRGLWLDWQAQGTRVTQNLFHDNTPPGMDNITQDVIDIGEDIFIEVSHGPTLVDNNVLLSDYAIKVPTQGCAFVHNLIAGSITTVGRGVNNGAVTFPSPRYTPYHVPHSTDIAGFMTILHGDMRFYNNIFVQKEIRPCMEAVHKMQAGNDWTDVNLTAGTCTYENYPTYEEYCELFEGYCGMGSAPSDRYYTMLPVWTGGNIYFNGAKPVSKEKDAYVDNDHKVKLELICDDKGCRLDTDLYAYLPAQAAKIISTDTLGEAFEPEQKFENPDGTPIVFNTDYFGNNIGIAPVAGPFANAETAGKVLF